MSYKEIEGNLFDFVKDFDVIAQGNNCFCVQGSGIAPQFVNRYRTDEYPMEAQWTRGDFNKMGQIDVMFHSRDGKHGLVSGKTTRHPLAVVNCYTQYTTGRHHDDPSKPPIDYEALTLCMRKIAFKFKGQRIGLPLIGCGLAGGIWSIDELSMHDQNTRKDLPEKDVKTIIQQELKDCNVTIVIYKP